MKKDMQKECVSPENEMGLTLDDLVKRGARQVIQQVIEAELAELLARCSDKPASQGQVLTFVICAIRVNMTGPLRLEYSGAIHLAIFIDGGDRFHFQGCWQIPGHVKASQKLRDESQWLALNMATAWRKLHAQLECIILQ